MAGPIDPVACDCCAKPLLPVFGSYNRVERDFGLASLPYVLCGECALQHRGNPTEARVREWVMARAARAGADWLRAVTAVITAYGR